MQQGDVEYPEGHPETFRKASFNEFSQAEKINENYQWKPVVERNAPVVGSDVFKGQLDPMNGLAKNSSLPFAAPRERFIPLGGRHGISGDRINVQYSNLAQDVIPETGFQRANFFQSRHQKILAFRHNLYRPLENQPTANEDDIRVITGDFIEKQNCEGSGNVCRLLESELRRCLLSLQYSRAYKEAKTRCLKWQLEINQCRWDQEKLERGYMYLRNYNTYKKRYALEPAFLFE